jgi:hypothetical protein
LGPGFHTGGFTVAFGHGHPLVYTERRRIFFFFDDVCLSVSPLENFLPSIHVAASMSSFFFFLFFIHLEEIVEKIQIQTNKHWAPIVTFFRSFFVAAAAAAAELDEFDSSWLDLLPRGFLLRTVCNIGWLQKFLGLILSLFFLFFEASVLSWQAACSRVTIYDPSGVVSAILHENCKKPLRERERAQLYTRLQYVS